MWIAVGASLVTTSIGDRLGSFDHQRTAFLAITPIRTLLSRGSCFHVEATSFSSAFVERTKPPSSWVEGPLVTRRALNTCWFQIFKFAFFGHSSTLSLKQGAPIRPGAKHHTWGGRALSEPPSEMMCSRISIHSSQIPKSDPEVVATAADLLQKEHSLSARSCNEPSLGPGPTDKIRLARVTHSSQMNAPPGPAKSCFAPSPSRLPQPRHTICAGFFLLREKRISRLMSRMAFATPA